MQFLSITERSNSPEQDLGYKYGVKKEHLSLCVQHWDSTSNAV